MWTLKTAAPSPFGRKAKIAASVCGFADRITTEKTDTNDAEDPLRSQNPLGKIPTLVLEDGTALYDSRVILEFYDMEAGGGVIIPARGRERIEALRLQALADGLMDAAVLQIYEARYRDPEIHSKRWLEMQSGKIERALASLEASPPAMTEPPHVGLIALACALGYLDFRFDGAWRGTHPRLVAWLDGFAAKVPSFADTAPS
jgi:glutathione S-transferase